MKKFALIAVFAVLIGAVSSQAAFAQDPFTKLGRGTANLLTGWVEIPKTSYATSQAENPFVGLTAGIWNGIGKGVIRTASGAYEMVTFPFAAPANYASTIEPEYVF